MNTIVLKSSFDTTDKKYTSGQFFKSETGKIYLLAKTTYNRHGLIEIGSNFADRTDDSMTSHEYTLSELTTKAGAKVLTPVDVTITEN